MSIGFFANAQEAYIQSGYTNLVIRSAIEISPSILSVNPLQDMLPQEMVAVNDSVYLASFYTFGPTGIRLRLLEKTYPFLMLPNQTSTITVVPLDTSTVELQYCGPFKEIFDESRVIYNLTGEGYYKHASPSRIYTSAVDYKDARLKRYNRVIDEATQQIDSELAKAFFANSFRMFMLSPILDYEFRIVQNNLNAGLDSLEAAKRAPPRDLNYYQGIVGPYLADTASLISGAYYEFLNAIVKDSLLDLPDLRSATIHQYKSKLSANFESIINSQDNLFYDMMIANAFIDQIAQGTPLSDSQVLDIIDYFENPEVPNYILWVNERSALINKPSGNKYYLPFGNNDRSVMESILAQQKDKVIVVDFWATWCGPCIEAFGESKSVKERFADKDVEFVYITDETSDVSKWHEYVSVLGGVHYFISREQMLALYNEFDFTSIPTYLIYDRNGKFVQKSVMYMGNERLTESLNNLLN